MRRNKPNHEDYLQTSRYYAKRARTTKPSTTLALRNQVELRMIRFNTDNKVDWDNDASDAEENPREPVGNVEVINIASFKTFRAILFYMHTNCITFGPLKTEFRDASEDDPLRSEYTASHTITYSSLEGQNGFTADPRSLYRLAHFLELKELQSLLFEHIKSFWRPNNILQELSTNFSQTFKEIRSAQLEYLKKHWVEARVHRQSMRRFMENEMFAAENSDVTEIVFNAIVN
jgi:hypothetical protein